MSGNYARFRVDQAVELELKASSMQFSTTADTYADVLVPGADEAYIVDSLYLRNTDSGLIQYELEIFSNIGGGFVRPFFVAIVEPGETCLAASKSTPIIVDTDNKIRMKARKIAATTLHSVAANVSINYTRYEL
jgi:hypothetical protein